MYRYLVAPSEAAPLLWLDEDIVTSSPLPFLPFLGIAMKFSKILPVYVPKSCRNDADVAEVLAWFSAGCKKEQPTLKSCKFSLS